MRPRFAAWMKRASELPDEHLERKTTATMKKSAPRLEWEQVYLPAIDARSTRTDDWRGGRSLGYKLSYQAGQPKWSVEVAGCRRGRAPEQAAPARRTRITVKMTFSRVPPGGHPLVSSTPASSNTEGVPIVIHENTIDEEALKTLIRAAVALNMSKKSAKWASRRIVLLMALAGLPTGRVMTSCQRRPSNAHSRALPAEARASATKRTGH